MSTMWPLRRLAFALLSTCTLSTVFVAAPVVLGTTVTAQAQVSAEFESALEPYGEWLRHPRWGMVWMPYDRPPGWRPYTQGHWVYTDEWGWYWISDEEEADWGWVTYHYGRWVLDRRMGWVWVPGDEWAPAWVDWRRGGDYVGWAPAPPDDVIYEYDDDPLWWIFVSPRYMTAPRVHRYVLPPRRTTVIIRRTVIVNRTLPLRHERDRFAVNPGIAPNIVAAIGRRPVQTFRVAPRVLPVTQGVQGAVTVQPQALKPGGRNAPGGARRPPPPNPQLRVSVQPTNQTVTPAAAVPKPQALPRNERGRLGDHPPRAAQGAQPLTQPAPATTPQPAAPAARPAPSSSTAPAPAKPTAPPAVRSAPPPAPPAAKPATAPPPPATQPPSVAKPTTPPAIKPATPPPPVQPAPQVRPQRPPQPQSPPPAAGGGRAPSPPVTHAPAAPTVSPPKAVTPPPVVRPAAPPPPAVQHAPPPVVRPAPPPPAAARPAAPGRPAEKKPPLKPGERPAEQPR